MQTDPFFTREQKYRLALFGLLASASVISIGLYMTRARPSPNGPYTSLLWNLLLAWVPFGLAWVAYTSTHLPKALMVILFGICLFFWLLFFPNALYILTDFEHLALKDTDTPVWSDVIMLLWFSWTGLFLGLASLYFMQTLLTRWFGRVFGWLFVAAVASLGSLGVYIGRFVYKNSWEVFTNPPKILGEILGYCLNTQQQLLSFSIPFGVFFFFVYLTFFVFGRLMNEDRNQN